MLKFYQIFKILPKIILAVLALFPVTAWGAFNLDCTTTDYSQSGYSESWGKTWVPTHNSFVIDGDEIYHQDFDIVGEVTTEDSQRLNFKIDFDPADFEQDQGAWLKGTYFKTTKKFVIFVNFWGNYKSSGGIWGICHEQPIM